MAASWDQLIVGIWVAAGVQFSNIVITAINRAADIKTAKLRHQWEREDRNSIKSQLEENTTLTIKAADAANAAYDAANHVEEKIAKALADQANNG